MTAVDLRDLGANALVLLPKLGILKICGAPAP
jgi:hypothetical protein